MKAIMPKQYYDFAISLMSRLSYVIYLIIDVIKNPLGFMS
jgi:hypothetical protein